MKSLGAPARSSTGVTPEAMPATKKVVAIIGAESAAGLGLVRAILEDLKTEFAPRAIVRSLDSAESRQLRKLGAELRVADPRDQSALARVLGGAYGAFYIQLSSEHPTPETKLATAHAVACAAKEVGLRHVIWATLEDPGQTFLEHNDVTPTFQNGRWMSEGEGQKTPEHIFTEMEIPTTFLHTAWEATVAAGKWTEDIGKHAYGLLRDRDSIGQTVSISAARMVRRPTPAPIPVPATKSEPVTAPSLAPISSTAPTTSSSPTVRVPLAAIAPLVEPASLDGAPAPVKSRKTVIIMGVVVAGALAGAGSIWKMQSRKATPAVDPIASPRAAELVSPPPVAVKAPEAQAAVPPPVVAAPVTAALPPVAAAPEAPPPPAEGAAAEPEEMVVATHERAGGKRNAGKNHKRLASKAGVVASAAASSPPLPLPAAPAPPPAVAPVKTEAPPKIEPPPERAAPAAPPAAPVTVAAPPKPHASAPPPIAPVGPQPGFVDPKAVNAVVRAHADEARSCYERATMEHPDLHGRLTIRAVIDANGRVTSDSTTSSIANGARLQSCLVRSFSSWVFPRPAGGVNGNVTYSFSFE